MTGVERKPMIKMHVGFDDTDSPRRGCTTYIAALLVEKLCAIGASFTDYPNLIRLNPNVPWKTRGNGALCLRIRCSDNLVDKIVETVIDAIEEDAELGNDKTDPGIVFLINNVPHQIREFAKRTIQGIVNIEEALKLIKRFKGEAVGFKKGRGIIGGLAAIGENLNRDHTYEIIAYRTPENRGSPRKIQASSVREMSEKTYPLTFNNLDPETGRILITPKGPDPILYGIRGENPNVVKLAHEIIRAEEPVERWVIFRTNHGTDAHLRKISSIREIKPYNPVAVKGIVAKNPKVIQGGHVIFPIGDKTGDAECAAYRPTGTLREISKNLIVGDSIEAFGGVRPASSNHLETVNLEKIRILKLSPKATFFNPTCPECGKRMKSMGTRKGFRCKKCGFRSSKLGKVTAKEKRELKRGLYITSPRSQRHLTKPLCRYRREKSCAPKKMIEDWHFP
jgi:tRNA(Ile2)-agmatinylcytidine synthase